MTTLLTSAERFKFELFFGGISITPEAEAFVMRPYGNRPLTLADYASTSGISLKLDRDVWVNAPIAEYNPNMVFDPQHELRVDGETLFVRNRITREEVAARFAPVPEYHKQHIAQNELFTDYVHTHTDRARISPIRGCAMRCKFCDIPFEFKGAYFPKSHVKLLQATERALTDTIQPASHVLISGGTPGKAQYDYLKGVYRSVLQAFPDVHVDIMMVPMPQIVDIEELSELGVHQLSLNIEIWDRERARTIMPEKFALGLKPQMDFIAQAVERLGAGRVRSILMVGLEPPESTLAAVEALARIGCVPVLSPFRPDPITDLAMLPPPTPDVMMRVFLEAQELAIRHGIKLGPYCIPCQHNTMTLADGSTDYGHDGRHPTLI